MLADEALGTPRELKLKGGRLRVFETGEGEPLVFVHGALVNADLWRKVVPLSAPGLADLIAEAVTALGLENPTTTGSCCGRPVSRRWPDHDPHGGRRGCVSRGLSTAPKGNGTAERFSDLRATPGR